MKETQFEQGPQPSEAREQSRIFGSISRGRRLTDKAFTILALLATVFGLIVLGVLVADVVREGLPRLSWEFITSYPSRRPEQAGILSALVGSIWLLVLTAIMAFPIGIGAAIYLEEYAQNSRWARFVEINISNLAGVPSIIYGLLGLGVFVRFMYPITNGRTVLAGALTMSLLILPVIIIATREAIRAVPDSIRHGAYAMGATQWQMIRDHVLPLAMPGSLTGTILALSRAIGETAPLITMGALTYIAYLPPLSPEGLRTPFTVLPIQIFNWISRPQAGFHVAAAAGIIVLLLLLLIINTTALIIRNRMQKRW